MIPAGVPLLRYWLFAGMVYYPFGGWRDFRDSFATLAAARAAAQIWQRHDTWYHVVDSTTLTVVAASPRQP